MFKTLFGKQQPAESHTRREALVEIDVQGLHYRSPVKSTAEWFARPFEDADSEDLAARLSQISLEGVGECRDHTFFLAWAEVYALLSHPEFASYREALFIPPVGEVRPRLISHGGLADSRFRVLIDEWVDLQGAAPTPSAQVDRAHIGRR